MSVERPKAQDPLEMANPKAFISYSHDGQDHKRWVHDLAARLRQDGVETILDQWHLVPGDQIPAFMERAIRENDFVLIVCTPRYKGRADNRTGGVGYEGDIISGEVLSTGNQRKFIPILRIGEPHQALPTSLAGKFHIDLRGDPYKEEQYEDLLNTLMDTRPRPPAVGGRQFRARTPKTTLSVKTPSSPQARNVKGSISPGAPIPPSGPPVPPAGAPIPSGAVVQTATAVDAFEPIRILGVIADQVSQPRNDGSRGSALYKVPLRLNREPPAMWKSFFADSWDHPSQFTSMHRPGIARVIGDRIVLDGTTMDELDRFHRATLKVVLSDVNKLYAQYEENMRRQAEEAARRRGEHQESIARKAKEIKFD